MARAGLAYPPGLDAARAGDIYGFACKGVSIEALKLATMKVIQGEVPDINRNFIPTPPAFAAIVKAEAAAMWRDRERILLALDAINTNQAPLPSEESRARVRAMVVGVLAAAEDAREGSRRGVNPEIPISAEQAERYSAMLALPDAKSVLPEHMAHRRVIAGKIDKADPPISPHIEPMAGNYFKALQQQEENENGEGSQIGNETEAGSNRAGGSEGQQERPFGFEDD